MLKKLALKQFFLRYEFFREFYIVKTAIILHI